MPSTEISDQERPQGKETTRDPGKRNEGHLWGDGHTFIRDAFRRKGSNSNPEVFKHKERKVRPQFGVNQ